MKEELSVLKIQRPAGEPAAYRRSGKKKIGWLLLAAILVLLLAFLYGQGLLRPAQEVSITTVSLVYPSQPVTALNASGYVVAQRKAAVASKGTGRLEFLAVEEGSRVKKGDLIARLENADLQAAINQAQANLNAARAHLNQIRAEIKNDRLRFDRYQKLVNSKAIAQADFDATEAKLNQALAAEAASQSQIKAAEAALEAT
ncbi:MAG: biotin/lipoyl-binding protein, partial [Deltaproteobacteria bacterium]|nr:biotin/lipoyl-binding protein [Deltaproteobacteria bacterium]